MLIPVGFYLEDLLSPLASAERTLVFYDPRGRGRSDAADSARVSLDHQIADLYAVRRPERVSRLAQVSPVSPSYAPHTDRAIAERQARMESAMLADFVARRDDLAGLDVPRLVIHGTEDPFPLEGSRDWVAGYAAAPLLVLERAEHWPFVERPEAFFPAVDGLLGGRWPAGATRPD